MAGPVRPLRIEKVIITRGGIDMTGFKAPVEHALVRNTVRILAGASQDQLTSTGTGFLYQVLTHNLTTRHQAMV